MATDAQRRTLRSLTIIVGLQWMGGTLGLPLLPLFLRHRGGSPTVVGFVMASFFIAGLLTQFGIGHLSDRFGRKKMMIAGLVIFAVASSAFLLPLSAAWFTLARASQGVGAGAFDVAALAAVSGMFAEQERGRAISRIFAAQLSGVAIGPMLGSLVPLNRLGWTFFGAAILSCVASLRVLRADFGEEVSTHEPLPKLNVTRQLIGAVCAAISVGLCVGVYETCWSLLMRVNHASTFQIRLSWTLFSVPWVLLATAGGWLADHANRKFISAAGLVNAAFFLFLYPRLHNVWLMLAMGPFESMGASLSTASTSSLLTQGAEVREMGRRQGISTSASTAALAISAFTSGALFSVNPALPFTVFAALSITCTATLLFWWRHAQGRINP